MQTNIRARAHTHTHTHTHARARAHAHAHTQPRTRARTHTDSRHAQPNVPSRGTKKWTKCEFFSFEAPHACMCAFASRCNKTIWVLISQLFSSLTLLHRAPYRVTTSRHSPSSLGKGRACSLLVQLNRASSFRLEKATEESGHISWLRVWSASLGNQGRWLTRRRTLCLRRIQPTAQHEFYFKPRRVYSLWWE